MIAKMLFMIVHGVFHADNGGQNTFNLFLKKGRFIYVYANNNKPYFDLKKMK